MLWWLNCFACAAWLWSPPPLYLFWSFLSFLRFLPELFVLSRSSWKVFTRAVKKEGGGGGGVVSVTVRFLRLPWLSKIKPESTWCFCCCERCQRVSEVNSRVKPYVSVGLWRRSLAFCWRNAQTRRPSGARARPLYVLVQTAEVRTQPGSLTRSDRG